MQDKINTLLERLESVREIGEGHRVLPSVEYLCACFDLNTKTGALTWKRRPVKHFKSQHDCNAWNTRWSGRRADVAAGNGYFLVCISLVRYKSHRVVFAMANGFDPGKKEIDHRDRNRGNNSPQNLRLATSSQNTVNLGGPRRDNTHGGRGVSRRADTGKWQACVCLNRKRIYLGVYENKAQAQIVADTARRELFGEYYS